MVNFKAALEILQAKNGHCALPDNKYDTIRATQVNCVTGRVTERDVLNLVTDNTGTGKLTLVLLDGVTGYESWHINDLKRYWKDTPRFCACTGTAGRWDELWLDAVKVKEIIDQCDV